MPDDTQDSLETVSPPNIIVFSLDREYKYISFNENHRLAMKQIWNVDIKIGENMLNFITLTEDREKAKTNFDRALKGDNFTLIEEYGDELVSRKYWEDIYSPIYDSTNEIIGLTVFVIDISKHKQAQNILRESVENYQTLFETITDIILKINAQCVILFYNKAFENITGYSTDNQNYSNLLDLIHEEDKQNFKHLISEILNGGQVKFFEFKIQHSDGHFICLQTNLTPLYSLDNQIDTILCLARDITYLKKIEEERIQALKLESIALLASGIAHDFNNILVGISGNISLIKDHLKNKLDVSELLDAVEVASERAGNLTKQLIVFAKGGEPHKVPASLNQLIKETQSFILRGSNVNANLTLSDQELISEVDTGQITQLFSNLLINSIQAMKKGGTIEIRSYSKIIPEFSTLQISEGEYAVIEIQDFGMGIPEKNKSKIFDPYFTTKDEGYGLGLPTCYNIVKKHGGTILFDTKENYGSTFKIYLPLTNSPIKESKESEVEDIKFHGKVLVLEDNDIVVQTLNGMIKALNLEVDISRNSNECIQKFTDSLLENEEYFCAIIDLTIPGGMGGVDTIKIIRELNSTIPCIVSSGYSDDAVMSDYKKFGFDDVLRKPYSLADLKAVFTRINTMRHSQ